MEPYAPTICSIKNEISNGPEPGGGVYVAPVRSLNEIVAGIRPDFPPFFRSCPSSEVFWDRLFRLPDILKPLHQIIMGSSLLGIVLLMGLEKLGIIDPRFFETLFNGLVMTLWLSVMIFWSKKHDPRWSELSFPRTVEISFTTYKQLKKDWEAAIRLAQELDRLFSLLSQISDPEMMELWQRKKQELGALLKRMDVVFKKATPTRFFPHPDVVVVYNVSRDAIPEDEKRTFNSDPISHALRQGFHVSLVLKVFLAQLPDTFSQENLTALRGRTGVRIETAPTDNPQLAEVDTSQGNNLPQRNIKKA